MKALNNPALISCPLTAEVRGLNNPPVLSLTTSTHCSPSAFTALCQTASSSPVSVACNCFSKVPAGILVAPAGIVLSVPPAIVGIISVAANLANLLSSILRPVLVASLLRANSPAFAAAILPTEKMPPVNINSPAKGTI